MSRHRDILRIPDDGEVATHWSLLRRLFAGMGILKLCAKPVTLEDWREYLQFLMRSDAEVRFADTAGTLLPVPSQIDRWMFDPLSPSRMLIDIAGMDGVVPLQSTDRLCLEIAASQIDHAERALVLFRLMSTLGRLIGKPVELRCDRCLGRYLPGSGVEIYLPPPRDE